MTHKFKILVEIVVEADEHEAHPIANDFAKMALRYKSIGAEASRVVSVTLQEPPCPTCGGAGRDYQGFPCWRCSDKVR